MAEREIKEITISDNSSGNASSGEELKGNQVHVNVKTTGAAGEIVAISLWRKEGEEREFLENKYSKIASNEQATATFSIPINHSELLASLENSGNSASSYIATASLIPKTDAEYYTMQGAYLAGDGTNTHSVYITTQKIINKNTQGSVIDWEKVKTDSATIRFTELYELNNKQMLDRAHWAYGEGGGNFAERYAMTIKNLRNSGVSGYGPKAFSSDEAMYKKTMTHQVGKTIKLLYPGYFDGSDGGFHAKAFANARKSSGYADLMANSKMVSCIRAVIQSLADNLTNEGYNNWRGSGDTLYTQAQKDTYIANFRQPVDQNLTRADNGRTYARIKTQIDHYWEATGTKFRRHSFHKITRINP